MIAKPPSSAVAEQPTDVRITHRCPRMREHMQAGCPCHPRLPIPCSECYSVLTTSRCIPYEPNRVVTPDAPLSASTAQQESS